MYCKRKVGRYHIEVVNEFRRYHIEVVNEFRRYHIDVVNEFRRYHIEVVNEFRRYHIDVVNEFKTKVTNNDLQNTTENLTIEQHDLYYKQGMNSGAPP